MDKSLRKKVTILLLSIILISYSIETVRGEEVVVFNQDFQLVLSNKESQNIIDEIICIPQPNLCNADGNIIGYINEDTIVIIKSDSPSLASIISKINSLFINKEKVIIVQNLRFDENGKFSKGTIYFEDISNYNAEVLLESKQAVSLSGTINLEKEADTTTLTIEDEKNMQVKINKAIFKNIKKGDTKTNAFLKLSNEGYLNEADFTSEQDTNYLIGNNKIFLPRLARLIFKNEKFRIQIQENSELEKWPTLIDEDSGGSTFSIEGKNIKLPTGNILNDGKILFIENQVLLSKGNKAIIDNTKIEATNTNVILNSLEEGCTNCISLSNGEIKASGGGYQIQLTPKLFADKEAPNKYLEGISLDKSKNKKYYSIGDEGEEVKLIQKLVGVDEDGIYGKKTIAAVKIWQQINNIQVDGKFGPDSLKTALNEDASQSIQIKLNDGAAAISSKNKGEMTMDLSGDLTTSIGSKTIEINDDNIYKEIKRAIANDLGVMVDLSIKDKKGNEILKREEEDDIGIKEVYYDAINFLKGKGTKGYVMAEYKSDIHTDTTNFDDIQPYKSLYEDKGIQSNTQMQEEFLVKMEGFVNSEEMMETQDPDERFNLIARKAGEITNYEAVPSLKIISTFGSRYKDLSPNFEEGYGNKHLVNGEDSSKYKSKVSPMSSKVAKTLSIPQDPNADKKYRLITVAGHYLYEEGSFKEQRIAIEHTLYEFIGIGGRIVGKIRTGKTPKYGSGDLGDISAIWGAVSFGKDLRNDPEKTLKEFDVKNYLTYYD